MSKADEQDLTLRAMTNACWRSKYFDVEHKNAKAWLSCIGNHILPTLGDIPVHDISVAQIRAVFAPWWREVPDMAVKMIA